MYSIPARESPSTNHIVPQVLHIAVFYPYLTCCFPPAASFPCKTVPAMSHPIQAFTPANLADSENACGFSPAILLNISWKNNLPMSTRSTASVWGFSMEEPNFHTVFPAPGFQIAAGIIQVRSHCHETSAGDGSQDCAAANALRVFGPHSADAQGIYMDCSCSIQPTNMPSQRRLTLTYPFYLLDLLRRSL